MDVRWRFNRRFPRDVFARILRNRTETKRKNFQLIGNQTSVPVRGLYWWGPQQIRFWFKFFNQPPPKAKCLEPWKSLPIRLTRATPCKGSKQKTQPEFDAQVVVSSKPSDLEATTLCFEKSTASGRAFETLLYNETAPCRVDETVINPGTHASDRWNDLQHCLLSRSANPESKTRSLRTRRPEQRSPDLSDFPTEDPRSIVWDPASTCRPPSTQHPIEKLLTKPLAELAGQGRARHAEQGIG
jgi:hypothetical protein